MECRNRQKTERRRGRWSSGFPGRRFAAWPGESAKSGTQLAVPRSETVEKVAKPLFRERLHKRQPSMSSSQAADRLHPSHPGCSLPPLFLLSQKTIKWFSGDPNKVGLSFVRGVISDVHAAGNDGLNFIPAAAAAGTPCRRAFSTSWSGAQQAVPRSSCYLIMGKEQAPENRPLCGGMKGAGGGFRRSALLCPFAGFCSY